MRSSTKKPKKLTIDAAADKLTVIMMSHLDTLPPAERDERLKAFHAVAERAAQSSDPDNTESTPSQGPCIPPSRVAARVR